MEELRYLCCYKLFIYLVIIHVIGGCNIEGEDDAYDFGSGAGFYEDVDCLFIVLL